MFVTLAGFTLNVFQFVCDKAVIGFLNIAIVVTFSLNVVLPVLLLQYIFAFLF